MSKEKIKHPEHLTPEIIQSALFIHNAEDPQDAGKRIQFLQNKFYNVNYTDLGHSFNAGDGFVAFVKTTASSTPKPDSNFTIVMTGSYT